MIEQTAYIIPVETYEANIAWLDSAIGDNKRAVYNPERTLVLLVFDADHVPEDIEGTEYTIEAVKAFMQTEEWTGPLEFPIG